MWYHLLDFDIDDVVSFYTKYFFLRYTIQTIQTYSPFFEGGKKDILSNYLSLFNIIVTNLSSTPKTTLKLRQINQQLVYQLFFLLFLI